jgi:hypothetical protein
VCGETALNIAAGVSGIHNGGGVGIAGFAGTTGEGVYGEGRNGVHGRSHSPSDSGVWGENTGAGYGVSGSTSSSQQPGASGTAGVWGNNADSGTGVKGTSAGGDGVLGQGNNNGVHGVTLSKAASGVCGENLVGGGGNGNGVTGVSNQSGGSGVWADNTGGGMGVAGTSDAPGGIGVYGRGGKLAGRFEGSVEVTGDVILANQDCAEDFDIAATGDIGPGTVMVIVRGGALQISESTYDKRVAGVVSGAGDFRPAIVLGKQLSQERRLPIALIGKVYCKVDASSSPIEVGDLLTTSPTPGHAMKALDPLKAFGAVIGKALQPLENGLGLIPILIALQ